MRRLQDLRLLQVLVGGTERGNFGGPSAPRDAGRGSLFFIVCVPGESPSLVSHSTLHVWSEEMRPGDSHRAVCGRMSMHSSSEANAGTAIEHTAVLQLRGRTFGPPLVKRIYLLLPI
jgi:hypothetical protein